MCLERHWFKQPGAMLLIKPMYCPRHFHLPDTAPKPNSADNVSLSFIISAISPAGSKVSFPVRNLSTSPCRSPPVPPLTDIQVHAKTTKRILAMGGKFLQYLRRSFS